MYQTGSTGIARVHIHTYIHIYNSVAATAAAALLPLHARVIVLAAAASCSAVPLCILLALRARVHGFCCCLLLWSLHHEYHCMAIVFFSCGTPAYVTPRGPPHSPDGNLVLLCTFVFAHRHLFPFQPGVLSGALGCGARREPASHCGEIPGPGGDPWHALWRYKIAKTGKKPRGRIPRT